MSRGVGGERVAGLLVLAGAALFGTVGTARVLGPDIPAAVLASVRVLLGAVLLALAVAVLGELARVCPALRARAVHAAGIAQAAFQVTFLAAVELVGVATGTLVAIGCTPLLAALLTWHLTRRWAVATAISVGGLVLLVGFSDQTPSVAGLAVALGASLSYAAYITAAHRAVAAGVANLPGLVAIFAVASVVLLPALVLVPHGAVWTGAGLTTALYLALVPTGLAYVLFNLGLRGVAPGTAATLGLIEPVVAAILGVAVLGEELGVLGGVGAVLVLAGLLVLVGPSRARMVSWARMAR